MLFDHNTNLINQIEHKLFDANDSTTLFPENTDEMLKQSAVLLPLGPACSKDYDHPDDPCIILNKRSEKVRQSGDLCCPGGGVSPLLDSTLARLLKMPRSPLTRWGFWSECKSRHPENARKLSVLYATSLRESFEEMRLNPMGVRFLGPLPPQQLRLRGRYIFPMAGWVNRQKKFLPNWEVDKILYIPIRNFLNPENYGVFRLRLNGGQKQTMGDLDPCYPCYRHETGSETEILWGATYRIVMNFLYAVFGFEPPGAKNLPLFDWQLSETYFVS